MARNKIKSRRKKKPQPISRWLWLITILMIIGLIAFLLYTTKSTPTQTKPNYPVNSTPPPGTEKPKIKYDFYEMLPSKQVQSIQEPIEEPLEEAPEEVINKPQQQTVKPSAPSNIEKPIQPSANTAPINKPKQFYISLGTYNKFDDADQLKAELTLLGFPVVIKSYNENNEFKFQVQAGPFENKEAAVAAQKEMQSFDINGQIISN